MALLQLPHTSSFPFVKRFHLFAGLSVAVFLLSLLIFFRNGLNVGADFQGGMLVEIRLAPNVSMETIRTKMTPVINGGFSIQNFGGERDVLLRLEHQPQNKSMNQSFNEKIRETLGKDGEIRRIETIGPKVGSEFVKNGLMAVTLALVSMLTYIWFRFQWHFGVCAFLALLHDCLFVLSFFILSRAELNETAIVALLITIAYSINDTVVVFDRIRENRNKNFDLSFPELINRSVNETLARTIWTSVTTLTALAALYFFGGPIVSAFSAPIFVGLAAGTYSSIFIAAPLLSYIKGDQNDVSRSS